MSVQSALYAAHWDYSLHAPYYQYRPNYSPRAIDALVGYTGTTPQQTRIVDVGAGTGNLSLLFLKKGFTVTAVEPNAAMLAMGEARTKAYSNAKWLAAGGEETTLADHCADWVTFGSSFSVLDRASAMRETHRLLKPRGFFTCLWNHRDLNDPVQAQAEAIILRHIPGYTRGIRREDQRPFLETIAGFKDIAYFETDFWVDQTREDYLKAWQSVKNKYWDLSTEDGQQLFNTLMQEMRQTLPETFSMRYTTRAWACQRAD